MNPEQLLNELANCMKNRPASTARRYWLVFLNGHYACIPMQPGPPDCVILGAYTPEELDGGLTRRQWGLLMVKIAKIKVDGGK